MFTRFPGGPVQPLLHLSKNAPKSTHYFLILQIAAAFSASCRAGSRPGGLDPTWLRGVPLSEDVYGTARGCPLLRRIACVFDLSGRGFRKIHRFGRSCRGSLFQRMPGCGRKLMIFTVFLKYLQIYPFVRGNGLFGMTASGEKQPLIIYKVNSPKSPF